MDSPTTPAQNTRSKTKLKNDFVDSNNNLFYSPTDNQAQETIKQQKEIIDELILELKNLKTKLNLTETIKTEPSPTFNINEKTETESQFIKREKWKALQKANQNQIDLITTNIETISQNPTPSSVFKHLNDLKNLEKQYERLEIHFDTSNIIQASISKMHSTHHTILRTHFSYNNGNWSSISIIDYYHWYSTHFQMSFISKNATQKLHNPLFKQSSTLAAFYADINDLANQIDTRDENYRQHLLQDKFLSGITNPHLNQTARALFIEKTQNQNINNRFLEQQNWSKFLTTIYELDSHNIQKQPYKEKLRPRAPYQPSHSSLTLDDSYRKLPNFNENFWKRLHEKTEKEIEDGQKFFDTNKICRYCKRFDLNSSHNHPPKKPRLTYIDSKLNTTTSNYSPFSLPQNNPTTIQQLNNLDYGSYQLDPNILRQVCKQFDFKILVDLFADHHNKQTFNYYCKEGNQQNFTSIDGLLGINAFAHRWNDRTGLYANPVFHDITQLINKVRKERINTLLLIFPKLHHTNPIRKQLQQMSIQNPINLPNSSTLFKPKHNNHNHRQAPFATAAYFISGSRQAQYIHQENLHYEQLEPLSTTFQLNLLNRTIYHLATYAYPNQKFLFNTTINNKFDTKLLLDSGATINVISTQFCNTNNIATKAGTNRQISAAVNTVNSNTYADICFQVGGPQGYQATLTALVLPINNALIIGIPFIASVNFLNIAWQQHKVKFQTTDGKIWNWTGALSDPKTTKTDLDILHEAEINLITINKVNKLAYNTPLYTKENKQENLTPSSPNFIPQPDPTSTHSNDTDLPDLDSDSDSDSDSDFEPEDDEIVSDFVTKPAQPSINTSNFPIYGGERDEHPILNQAKQNFSPPLAPTPIDLDIKFYDKDDFHQHVSVNDVESIDFFDFHQQTEDLDITIPRLQLLHNNQHN